MLALRSTIAVVDKRQLNSKQQGSGANAGLTMICVAFLVLSFSQPFFYSISPCLLFWLNAAESSCPMLI